MGIWNKIVIVACLWLSASSGFGQTITGFVQDENNQPIPFVNVFIKHTSFTTETDGDGKYFFQLDPQDYELVFDAFGYRQKTVTVFLHDNEDLVKNVWLESDTSTLEEVVVNRKRKDPAYGIIAKAVEKRKENQRQIQSSRSEVYIKAKEVISEREKKKRQKAKAENSPEGQLNKEEGQVEFTNFGKKEPSEEQKIANSMNLVEIQLTKSFQAPNKIKEVKTGYEKYGSDEGLYYLSTTTGDMDFYNTLVTNRELSDVPFISPLNGLAVASYKFKLEEYIPTPEKQLIYKIKVTPRKEGNSTISGYIYIHQDNYRIAKIDFNFPKGGLLFYDKFRLQQEYTRQPDSSWIVTSQEFDYQTKIGGRQFKGNTLVTYKDVQLGVTFPKRFFSNEVGVVTEEAYERDSSYWSKIRPAPLTKEEQRFVAIKDSIEAVQNSEKYLDSIDKDFNKITFMKVIWNGIGFRNRAKQIEMDFGSLSDWFKPFQIGGWRYGPYVWFYKKWDSERAIIINPDVDIGFRNKDVKGSLFTSFLYNPVKQSRIQAKVGRDFRMFTTNDGILSLFNRANWVDQLEAQLKWRTELFNGFYIGVEGTFFERKPITGLEFGTITEDIIDNNQPLDFVTNQALTGEFYFTYTPFQKYVREPKRKVVLGSKWPTIGFYFEHGFKDILSSDIDFTYISASLEHQFNVRSLGTSSYRLKSGKFLNNNSITIVDSKIFPRGDRVFFSSPLHSFQLQDTTLTANNDIYFEAHYIHQFNGAIMNNIPLLKKTRITFSAGGGMLYIKESDYFYKEAFAGMARSFRIGRERLRFGIYGVIGDSNFGKAIPALKFSVSFYNRREKKWGF